jgi:dienelactone hydrolase
LSVVFNQQNDSMIQICNDAPRFNITGNALLFTTERRIPRSEKKYAVELNIWNYQEEYLQSEQMKKDLENPTNKFFVCLNLKNNKHVTLAADNELTSYINFDVNDRVVIAGKTRRNDFDTYDQLSYLNLLDFETCTVVPVVKPDQTYFNSATLSPDGRFVVWFDKVKLTWFSYHVDNGLTRDIGAALRVKLHDEEQFIIGRVSAYGLAGWIKQQNAVLIYDEFDIWKVPLDGGNPQNLTCAVGRKASVGFMISNEDMPGNIFNETDTILLTGYCRKDKSGGYFPLRFDQSFTINKSSLKQFSVAWRLPPGYVGVGGQIIKAKDAAVYLVISESAASSRNVYLTTDFKNYKEISDIHPEKKYHWITSELITWRTFNGIISQGILYKPENFDSSKKYPVIFDYYEKRSDELHKFIIPRFSANRINIPAFVDLGYLVFVPDIHCRPGKNGEGSYNAIESAARYLSKFSFIDSNRLGLQGHSYGGWQTNYMITHSRTFAAACEAAGTCNHVSGYGQLSRRTGSARSLFYETGSQGSPYGSGITPWTRPDLYIQNSPIFMLGEITTPLLMMHNLDDPSVPFEQAIEMFTGMKRAGKKVWLLQYDGEGHDLSQRSAEDFHKRMLQFFNHYLKNEPAPVWMTRGIPAILKGRDDGFAIDSSQLTRKKH